MTNKFNYEYNKKEELSQSNHKRRIELENLKEKIFNNKQDKMKENMAFLWELKFKFMREQDDRYNKRIDKVFKLKQNMIKNGKDL